MSTLSTMLSFKSIGRLAFLCSFYSTSFAAPYADFPPLKRDASTLNNTSSTNSTGPTNILEPVLPPNINQNDLSILNLDPQTTLAWAGATSGSNSNPNSTARRLLKRDGSAFAQANFTFAYPVIPLDHSAFISGVSCSNNNTLTGILTSNAYGYAKSQWSGAGSIVFVTAVDGCGADATDDFFLATSVAFTDSSSTFVATGSSALIQNVASHMNLQWGNVGTTNVKRSVDKSTVFEPHSLEKRARADFSFTFGSFLNDDDLLGEDLEAPWPFAAKLFEWGKEGGEEDDSYEKGEVASSGGHHRRSNTSALTAREEDGLDFGLRLYCVECGFGGQVDLWGEVDVSFSILPPFFSLSTVEVGMGASMYAGVNLGVWAFVKYEKTWTKELDRIYLENYGIPDICDVGPFLSLSVQASAGIEASGQLLLGADITWDGFEVTLDLLSPSDSSITFPAPTFQHTANASGEVSVEAGLGLPVELGVGIRLLGGLWKAEGGIVDTPSVVLEGKFEVSADVTPDGTIEYDINGGCYGIAWDVHFENELDAVISITDLADDSVPLVRPEESDPIAQGCIGYVDDGTDDDDDNPQGTGSDTGLGGNGLNSAGDGLAGAAPGDTDGLAGGSPGSNGASSSSSSLGSSSTTSATTVKANFISISSSTVPASSSSSSSSLSSLSTSIQPQLLAATSKSSTSSSSTSSSSTTSKSTTSSSSSSTSSSSTTSKSSTSSSSSSTSSTLSTSKLTTSSSSSSSTTTIAKTTSTSAATTSTTSSSSTKSSSTSTTSSTKTSSSTSTSSTTSSKSSSSSTTITTSAKTTSSSTTSSSSSKSTTTTAQAQQATTSKTSSTSSTSTSSTSSSKTTCTPSTSVVSNTAVAWPSGTSTSSTTSSTSTKTSTSTSTSTSTAIACKTSVAQASVPTANALGTATTVNSADLCAANCFKTANCLSFSFSGSPSNSCQLYNKAYKNLAITTKNGSPSLTFYDHDCYMYSTCPK